MARVVTLSELKNINPDSINESRSVVQKALKNSQQRINNNNSVFVSYSSKDSETLPAVLKVISGHGGTPYVDKADKRLPDKSSKETADILKKTIIASKKLVVFVTSNTKNSKWVPWELGIGDGAKKEYDIALFPSTENMTETKWYEQEYFGLYRRILWGKLEGQKDSVWMVYNLYTKTAIELSRWIKE